MTYPYGLRGAPAVGLGIPGLPQRVKALNSDFSAAPSDGYVAIGESFDRLARPDLSEKYPASGIANVLAACKVTRDNALSFNYAYAVALHPTLDICAVGYSTSASSGVALVQIEGDRLAGPNRPVLNNSWSIAAMCYSPDGKFLAIGRSISSSPLLISTLTGETHSTPGTPPAASVAPSAVATALAYSPDSQHLALGCAEPTTGSKASLAVYKVSDSTHNRLTLPSAVSELNHITGLTYSPDGRYLLVGSRLSPFVHVFERVGDTYTAIPQTASFIYYGRSFAFLDGGRKVLYAADTTTSGNYRFVFDFQDGVLTNRQVLPDSGGIDTIVGSPNGDFAIAFGRNSKQAPRIYRIINGQCVVQRRPNLGLGCTLTAASFSSDGALFAFAASVGNAALVYGSRSEGVVMPDDLYVKA